MGDPRLHLYISEGVLHERDALGNVIREESDFTAKIVTPGKSSTGKIVAFAAPSAVALSLEIAINAAKTANSHRDNVEQSSVVGRTPSERWIYFGPDDQVFNCLQEAMISVAFSYQALETYCNQQLELHKSKRIKVTTGRGNKRETREMLAGDADMISTETKLTQALPQILDLPTPGGSKPIQSWSLFKQLQKDRIAIVHMVASTSNPRAPGPGQIPRTTVFNSFLTNDSLWMPRTALDLLDHFKVNDPWKSYCRTRMENESVARPQLTIGDLSTD
jgi:hypothetical protein